MTEQALPPQRIEETVIASAEVESKQFEQEIKALQLKEKAEFLEFRKQWSRNLLYLVIFIVLFNAIFLIAVGLGWLKFMDEWLVRIIIGGSVAEVLGLAKIVVDFLFKEPPTK